MCARGWATSAPTSSEQGWKGRAGRGASRGGIALLDPLQAPARSSSACRRPHPPPTHPVPYLPPPPPSTCSVSHHTPVFPAGCPLPSSSVQHPPHCPPTHSHTNPPLLASPAGCPLPSSTSSPSSCNTWWSPCAAWRGATCSLTSRPSASPCQPPTAPSPARLPSVTSDTSPRWVGGRVGRPAAGRVVVVRQCEICGQCAALSVCPGASRESVWACRHLQSKQLPACRPCTPLRCCAGVGGRCPEAHAEALLALACQQAETGLNCHGLSLCRDCRP